MGFYTFPPPVLSATVNSSQLGLGSPTTITPVALVVGTQQTIIPADAAATLGRLIDSIANPSTTALIFVAHGRPATVTNYDYIIHPQSAVNDKRLGTELVSAICTVSNVSVCATYRSIVEVA